MRAVDDQVHPPPLETTSHWILNDRLVGQLQLQAVGSAAVSHPMTGAVDKGIAAANDVIVISSSQEDSSASDCSFMDQRERVVTAVPSICDEDVSIANDEQFYNFGEEEEFLSQAAVARWQEGAESQFILDDSQHGTHCLTHCDSSPSPAQQLLHFLALHNLDSLEPTLMDHEVSSLNCMCMLTQNDIAYVLALCCLRAPLTFCACCCFEP
jgi:hypothetical protein